MDPKFDWDEIIKYVLNESSEEERTKIESELKTNRELRNRIKELNLLTSVNQKKMEITDVNLKWEEVRANLNDLSKDEKQTGKAFNDKIVRFNLKSKARKRFFTVWRYAAILFFTVVASYFLSKEFFTPQPAKKIEFKVLSVKRGERKTIVLYDGTTINLDSGSELKYPEKFGEKSREVYLKGEGFFQVAKNPKKPFRIYANNGVVEVLGTKFNVRSWEDSGEGVTVTVSEGKVSLSAGTKGRKENVILTKNMQSNLSLSGKLSEPVTVDASNFSKWMNNEMDFKNASLKQVIMQLERWYDLDFVISDKFLDRKNLTIHLNNTNLNDVLDLISVITNTTVERHGKKIYFLINTTSDGGI